MAEEHSPEETLDQAAMIATGADIARMQEPSGAITWPDGHVEAWDHVESAMAMSGLRAGFGRPGERTGGCARTSGPTAPGRGPPWRAG